MLPLVIGGGGIASLDMRMSLNTLPPSSMYTFPFQISGPGVALPLSS